MQGKNKHKLPPNQNKLSRKSAQCLVELYPVYSCHLKKVIICLNTSQLYVVYHALVLLTPLICGYNK